MMDLNYDIKYDMKFCSACRNKLSYERKLHVDNKNETVIELLENDNVNPGRSGDAELMNIDESFKILNESLIS